MFRPIAQMFCSKISHQIYIARSVVLLKFSSSNLTDIISFGNFFQQLLTMYQNKIQKKLKLILKKKLPKIYLSFYILVHIYYIWLGILKFMHWI